MNPTDQHIREIAELLECDLLCFFHKQTGEIKHYPNPDNAFFEIEFWQEIIDSIEAERSNYFSFEVMSSYQKFQVMENFAYSISNENDRHNLISVLSNAKPFRNFKQAIKRSVYLQDWYNFQKEAYIQWVKKQLYIQISLNDD
ncbi:MAG: hypothetical protein JJ895_07450 [Balneolaceae bacterium]|nr:hypothetical protein [Balneolaceae bacterium]